ncbi:MAG: 4-hydroxy-tetrahydrodipicolinate synthase [Ruminococcaceae bacterium]|nr:4-hydroxy-tetrahydrodipicolinate synthase [Oscillospiraceae bacterium]
MKKRIFTGAATALITPMNDDYTVNYERLETLVEQQIKGGIDALVMCGTTGEKSTLRYDEHVKVIEVAARIADGRVPIIAGTGSNDTVYSVELCDDAAAAGADAFLMVTPYYNKTSQEGLIAHYNYIADRVRKPIILYNVPSRTGVNIKPETYKELSKHRNIIATKEASGDLSQIAKIKYLCGDDLDIYSGNDDQTVPIMSIGGLGVISVLSNILPYEMHKLCDDYLSGNINAAQAAQIKFTGIIDALFSDVNPIPIKEAMNMLGMEAGPCRLPLYPMNEGASNILSAKLKEVGLFTK